MNLLGIQLAGIFFGMVFLYLTYLNYKREELNEQEGLFWCILWIGLILTSIFPDMLNFIVNDILNISRTLDFLIIISFMFLFGIVFYIFIITKKTKNKVEKLVRNIALDKSKTNRK
ncbi:MAG: DUF2304 domain-containing protein [Candidatus Woesearchaeota archaeon]